MRNVKILGFFAFFLLFIPLKVKAKCSYEQMSMLKKIADNINISYVYNEANGYFETVITNINTNVYLYDTELRRYYRDTFEVNASYGAAKTVKLNVHSNLKACQDELIAIRYVNLPFYNKYYDDYLCKDEDLKNHALCQKWVTHGIKDYKSFQNELFKYKKSLIVENVELPVKPNVPVSNKNIVLEFLLKYYYYILILIIAVCLFVIYREVKKDSFGF